MKFSHACKICFNSAFVKATVHFVGWPVKYRWPALPREAFINSIFANIISMEALKYEAIGNCRVTVKTGYEFLLSNPAFLSALDIVRTLKPLSVPLLIREGARTEFFHVRRTRRNHFSFLHTARSHGVHFPEPVVNVRDPDIHRFYLVTTYSPVKPLVEFIAAPAVTVKRKLGVLRKIAGELVKLNKANLRHGNVTHSSVYVGKGDEVMLYNPELDGEVVEHLQSDLEQYRETLFHLERELDHEPAALWEAVRSDSFFKNLK